MDRTELTGRYINKRLKGGTVGSIRASDLLDSSVTLKDCYASNLIVHGSLRTEIVLDGVTIGALDIRRSGLSLLRLKDCRIGSVIMENTDVGHFDVHSSQARSLRFVALEASEAHWERFFCSQTEVVKTSISNGRIENSVLGLNRWIRSSLSDVTVVGSEFQSGRFVKCSLGVKVSSSNLIGLDLSSSTIAEDAFSYPQGGSYIDRCRFPYGDDYDPRGYKIGYMYNQTSGELSVRCGCRHFTVEEAIEHWGSSNYEDPRLGAMKVAEVKQIRKLFKTNSLIYATGIERWKIEEG